MIYSKVTFVEAMLCMASRAVQVEVVYTPFKAEQEQLVHICVSIVWLSSFFFNVVIAWECWTQEFSNTAENSDDETGSNQQIQNNCETKSSILPKYTKNLPDIISDDWSFLIN